MRFTFKHLMFLLAFGANLFAWGQPVLVLSYHRFNEHQYPESNISDELFEAHIKMLQDHNFEFIKASEITEYIHKDLDHPVVAITIDDGFKSMYDVAWPIIQRNHIPITAFIVSSFIEARQPGYVSWDHLNEMVSSGLVEIGGHSYSHPNLVKLSPEMIMQELITNRRFLKDKLGTDIKVFAFPYGGASKALMPMLKQQGFNMAFGQHSGFVTTDTYAYYVPRFPMNNVYGSNNRFKSILSYQPLEVINDVPYDPWWANTKTIDIQWKDAIKDQVACYQANGSQPLISWRDEYQMTITPLDLSTGFNRINCTHRDDLGHWHWYGMQFYKPKRKES